MSVRFRASGIHFLISTGVAFASALLVFLVWYPSPYEVLAGGLTLFAMVVGIDVVLGPLLTALVANPKKSRTELRRDIALIVVVQILAFFYGMYTVAMARPVHLVFEIDRFRVVSAADISPAELEKAAPAYRHLSWIGPTLIAARKSTNQEEMIRSLDLGLQGVDISMQPDRWIDYASSAEAVLQKARPVNLLLAKYPAEVEQVRLAAANSKVDLENIYFLPMDSRSASGSALIAAPDARIIGYLAVDGFFTP
jgi:hypothetical protein